MTVPALSDPTLNRPPGPRRWMPLSLRMYLSVLAAVGVASIACVGAPMYRQHVAIREIERLRGYVLTSPGGPKWLRAWLGRDRMKIFDEVLYVDFRGTRATDATLGHVGCLKSMAGLSLHGTEVTDAGLEHLKGMTNLENLSLFNTHVTDAGLAHLKGLNRLHNLFLDRTQVTDAGLVQLEGLTSLEDLSLGSTQVSDASLVHLKRLTRLKYLWLRDTQVTGARAAELKAALPNLKILHPSSRAED